LRIEYPGAFYHIMNRGQSGRKIFLEDQGRQSFLDLLTDIVRLWKVEIFAYCLMDNHYHLLLSTPAGVLSRPMRHLDGIYTQRFNRLHHRDGRLFRGRYKAILVDAEEYFLSVVRYIHKNPLGAGLVSDIDRYRWSSHRGYLNKTQCPEWLDTRSVLSRFGGVRAYQRFMHGEVKKRSARRRNHEGSQMLKSRMCSLDELRSFEPWVERLRSAIPRFGIMRPDGSVFVHRKTWEWGYIAQALAERGMLGLGKRGLGFAVGREPVPALFASMGCQVLATDLGEAEAEKAGWVKTAQHADSLATLEYPGLCAPADFRQRVTFRPLDMRALPDDLTGSFDFTWSACSLEHLGSIDQGIKFILDAMRLLRRGGVAIHTTEFNVTSLLYETDTLSEGGTVLFRREDIERAASLLRRDGHRVELDWTYGATTEDRYVDVPPYRHDPHLKLRVESFVTTSIGLIIEAA
jgi:REP element-mobilizing transposase RayT